MAMLGAGDLNIAPSGAANRFDWALAAELLEKLIEQDGDAPST